MKKTTKEANGTSFHDTTIRCSVKLLKEILGECTYGNNDGQDKVNYEWVMETEDGDVFTLYDWKEDRILDDNDSVEWHIGGFSRKITEQAKIELVRSLYEYAF